MSVLTIFTQNTMKSRKNTISDSKFPVGCDIAADAFIYQNRQLAFRTRKARSLFDLPKTVCRFLVKFTFAFTKQRAERLQNLQPLRSLYFLILYGNFKLFQ